MSRFESYRNYPQKNKRVEKYWQIILVGSNPTAAYYFFGIRIVLVPFIFKEVKPCQKRRV